MSNMSVESGAVVLFAVGVLIVLIYEVVAGIICIKGNGFGKALLGHAVFLFLAFACTAYLLHAPKVHESYAGSGFLALTGILWAVAEFILIHALLPSKRQTLCSESKES